MRSRNSLMRERREAFRDGTRVYLLAKSVMNKK